MKRIPLFIFLMLPLIGQTQTTLSLEECIAMAKEKNRKIEVANLQSQIAQYEQRSTKAMFFPTISLSGNVLYSTAHSTYSLKADDILSSFGLGWLPPALTDRFPSMDFSYRLDWAYNGGIKVVQPIYAGGKIRAGYNMAVVGNEIATLNNRLTEAEVIVETSRAYAEVVRAKELMQVAASYNNLLSELMRSMENARKHGMEAQNNVLKVKVKLDESTLSLCRAQNGYRLAKMNLCHYIGLPLMEPIDVDSSALPEASNEDATIVNRPEYQILEQKSELARLNIDMARSDYLPQIGLMGQFGYMNGLKLNDSKLMDGWSVNVGVSISIPIFDFGYRMNKIRSAKTRYTMAEAEREDLNEQMMLEMTLSANNLHESLLERDLAESALTSAEENLRISRLQYERGMEMLSDYLEAQALWQQSRQTLIDARVNCYLKWLEYQKTTGVIN